MTRNATRRSRAKSDDEMKPKRPDNRVMPSFGIFPRSLSGHPGATIAGF
jgi:hypothetical protein